MAVKPKSKGATKPTLVVHGGCGTPPAEEEEARIAACERAADVGWQVLRKSGSAVDAVEAAVRQLEDEPLLNAGTGSYLRHSRSLPRQCSLYPAITSSSACRVWQRSSGTARQSPSRLSPR